MWAVMIACVIIYNTIIESECAAPVVDDQPYDVQVLLSQLDDGVHAEFADFLVMHTEIRNKDTHVQLQKNLFENL